MKPNPPKQQAYRAIQKRLGYEFRDMELLQQTLVHRGYSAKHNERFEFVDDSISNYSVARTLFDAFPKLSEGELSRTRAALVNESVLAETALEVNVSDGLHSGAGESKSGGFRRPSILAGATEAVFAVVSLDADFSAAEKVVRHLFAERVRRTDLNIGKKDSKTVLQEALQVCRFALPKYRIEEQAEQTVDAMFAISRDLDELSLICNARGSSWKVAEQKAACEASERLEQKFPLKKPKK